jgi:hypothetical protein
VLLVCFVLLLYYCHRVKTHLQLKINNNKKIYNHSCENLKFHSFFSCSPLSSSSCHPNGCCCSSNAVQVYLNTGGMRFRSRPGCLRYFIELSLSSVRRGPVRRTRFYLQELTKKGGVLHFSPFLLRASQLSVWSDHIHITCRKNRLPQQ